MKRNFLLLSIITCVALILMQCKKESETKELRWATYTTSDGLVSNNVLAIAIDKDGNKWFGTDAGVSKFDGTTWTNYKTSEGLVSDYVMAIAIDAQGNKWFGTWYGVSKFNGTTWTTYTEEDGLFYNWITGIAIDEKDNKWFGNMKGSPYCSSTGGITKYDNQNWIKVGTPPAPGVEVIAADLKGNIWIGYDCSEGCQKSKSPGCNGIGVSKFDGTTWTTYTEADGLINNTIGSIAIDNEGNKWFGTKEFGIFKSDGGVSKFDDTNWTNYTTSDGLVNRSVHVIAIDKEGNKWFGTDEGVSKFNGTNWITYTTVDSLVNNYVNAIAIDEEGNKWFGTGNGVSKLFETSK